MDKAVTLSEVSFSYKSNTPQKWAVDCLNLEIEKGSFVAISGENGSGKTTLAKLLNGILSPTSGVIERTEQPVALVFQNPDNQIVASIVEDDTAFGPENLGYESRKIADFVNKALRDVSMEEHSEREINSLSGGQKQKICIAGALAMQSSCLVLDEPCSMLDPEGKKSIMTVLKALNKAGCTIIMITHDMDLAALSDRLVILSKGKIKADGKPEDIFEDEKTLKECSLKLSPALEFRKFLNWRSL